MLDCFEILAEEFVGIIVYRECPVSEVMLTVLFIVA